MKTHYFLGSVLLLLTAAPALAQVGIGTPTPNPAAALDISSSGKGLLIPRLDSAQRVAIASPPDGLMVFQRDGRQPGFWYAIGGGWLYLPDDTRAGDNLGNHTATQSLNLQGNALTGTGADVGTAVGVGIRADGGLNLAQNTAGNNLLIGYQAGQALTATSFENQLIGYRAGRALTTGNRNHFIGYAAGEATTGSNNHFEGYRTGNSNTTGRQNYFSGYQAGFNNIDGSFNTFVGNSSGAGNTSGANNTFVGQGAGNTTAGTGNYALGYQAGPSADGLTNAGAIGTGARVSQSNALVLGTTSTRVGIGVAAPQATLDVNGGLRVRGLSNTGYVVSRGGSGDFAVVPPSSFENTTAANGLNLAGTAVRLGGPLSQNTSIEGGPYGLTVNSAPQVAVVVDQQQLNGGVSTAVNGTWQSFTAGQTGVLTSVEVRMSLTGASSQSSLTVNVYAGTGTGGALLATSVGINYGGSTSSFDVLTALPTPPPVTAGQVYTFELVEGAFASFGSRTVAVATGNPYAGGTASSGATTDLRFVTRVQPVVSVPVLTLANASVRLPHLVGPALLNVAADGTIGTQSVASVGDNLGKHTATQNLSLGTFRLTGSGTSGLSIAAGGAVQVQALAGTGTRVVTADAAGTLGTSAVAATVLDALLRAQRGTAALGTSAGTAKVVSVTFPAAFAAVPGQVVCTVRTATGATFNDTFAATTKTITATGFTVNIWRVDDTANWGQALLLDWLAIP